MLKMNNLAKDRKCKLQLSHPSAFQSIIRKQIIQTCRMLQSYSLNPSHVHPLQEQSQTFGEKRSLNPQGSELEIKKQDTLQDLIQQRQLFAQTSRQKLKKISLQKQFPKNKNWPTRQTSTPSKTCSLPKLHFTCNDTTKLQNSLILNQSRSTPNSYDDVLLRKLLDGLRQHMLLRKEPHCVCISVRELLRFLNFLIQLVKCEGEEGLPSVFQRFPNYSFFKDIAVEVFRFYEKGDYEPLSTQRSQGTSTSLKTTNSKQNMNPKTHKKHKYGQKEFKKNKRQVSVVLKSETNEQQHQKVKTNFMFQMQKEFGMIQAMLKDYMVLKSSDFKENKKRYSINSLQEHVIHQMEIFHKKVLNDIHLVPDVKQKLMKNTLCRAFQKRYSKEQRDASNDPKLAISQAQKQIMTPLVRLKNIIKGQLKPKTTQRAMKQNQLRQNTRMKQVLQEIVTQLSLAKQNALIDEQIWAKLHQIEEFCQGKSSRNFITQSRQK